MTPIRMRSEATSRIEGVSLARTLSGSNVRHYLPAAIDLSTRMPKDLSATVVHRVSSWTGERECRDVRR